MSGTAGSDVGATVREMWETRPARRADDKTVAGVAAGIARRYATDPTLVRIAFVVAAFYGVGILLYVAGWLVLPSSDAAGARRERPNPVLNVVAVIVGLVALGPLLGGEPRTALGLLVVGALLYALHRSRSALGVVDGAPAPAGVGVPTGAGAGGTGPGEPDRAQRPPSWDPLGAAPFAWDLPEPAGPPPPSRPRSRLTPVTLALALVAAGVAGQLGLLGVVPFGVTPVVGTALAVVGVGLVVGAFLRRGRGLIVAAVPLALVLVAASAASGARFGEGWRDDAPWGDDTSTSRGMGDVTYAPSAAADVAPSYRTGLGDADLDLRGLPAGPPVRTEVTTGMGDATVRLPLTADVTADCTSGSGDVDCLGRAGNATRLVDTGPDGPGGPVVDLRVTSGAGEVEVTRG